MAPSPSKPQIPWISLSWFGLLIAACYAPALYSLASDWVMDADMGHGFFVPVISAFIIWQKREALLAIEPQPNLWGLVVVLLGGAQLIAATLGVELFLTHTAFVIRQKREALLAIEPQPNLWGLVVVLLGGAQLIAATLGVELFLTHTAFVI